MSYLTLFVGPPGSSKSTRAKALCAATGAVYISQDAHGKQGHWDRFKQALANDDSIVVDRLNFNASQRKRYLDAAKEEHYETTIIVLHVGYDECLRRCVARKDHETIKEASAAVKALNMFFSKYERVQDSEADVVIRDFGDNEKKQAVCFDADGTMSDPTHRRHFVRSDAKKDWKGFFEGMKDDPVHHWCRAIANSMFPHYEVLIVSARPDNYRELTEQWLKDKTVSYDKLLMRKAGDYRPDTITKEQIFEFEIKPYYDILFVIDDRKNVIDQWRKMGVVCLDCAGEKGDF